MGTRQIVLYGFAGIIHMQYILYALVHLYGIVSGAQNFT